MSSFYSGQNGRLQINGVTAAKVASWTLNSSQAALSTTVLSDTDNTFISGIRTTTGSCRLYYYDYVEGASIKNDASTLLKTLIKSRTASASPGVATESESVTLKLQIIDGGTSKEIEVEAIITSAAMAMNVGEVLAADIQFQVNGAPVAVVL